MCCPLGGGGRTDIIITIMIYNLNSGYGRAQASGIPFTTGKVFFVAGATDAGIALINQTYVSDVEGILRVYATVTSALAQCTTGRGDVIVLGPSFVTALTAAELLSAETKGVTFFNAGQAQDGSYTVHRAAATLPATTQTPYFTVTGRVKILSIIGQVTTIVQTQACNAKLTANPTVGADVDMCADLNITAAALGAQLSITGTLADALVKTVSGVGVFQAFPQLVQAGTIDLTTSATNTGATKWQVKYVPIDPGARVFAA